MPNINDKNLNHNARGFSKDQIVKRDGQPVLRLWNPLKYDYDGMPPAGTVLPGEDGDPINCFVIFGIDPDGNMVARREDRPTQGGWQYLTVLDGMILYHPGRGTPDRFDFSVSFLCG